MTPTGPRWSRIRRARGLLTGNSPFLLILGRLGATAIAFVTSPIIARTIGPEGRGETAAALALFFILPIVLAVGVPLEVRRQTALGRAPASIRTARLFCLVALPASSGLALIAYSTIFVEFDDFARHVGALGVALSPMMMSWMCDNSVLVASGRFRGVLALQLIQPAVFLVSILAFLVGGVLEPATVLISSLSGTGATFLTGLALTRVSIRGELMSARELAQGGLRCAGSSIAEAASSRLDQVLVLPLLGAYQAGLYSVAVTVATVPISLGHALGAVYFPLIARATGEDRQVQKARAVRASLALSMMAAPILFVGIWIGIPLLFGEEFTPAVRVSWVAGIGTLATISSFVCSQMLAAEGRGYRMTAVQAASLAVAIGLLYVLAPLWGAVGAAAASSISYLGLLAAVIISLEVRPNLVVPRRQDFRGALVDLLRGR